MLPQVYSDRLPILTGFWTDRVLMPKLKKLLKIFFYLTLVGVVFAVLGVAGTYWYVSKDLPDVASARNIELQVPLKIVSSEGLLIASFGETRRNPMPIERIPSGLRHAFIAVEDGSFYRHYGIDPKGIARALWEIVTTGEKGVGGSTITQQLARGLYLSSEKTFKRKIIEIFTAIRLERSMSKDEILELYLNKIFLGQRAYGVAAAAEVYYGKFKRSLRLDGLSTTNSNIRARAIVFHGWDKVKEENIIQGMSWGCWTIDWKYKDAFVDKIKEGSLFYAGVSTIK